MSLLTQYSATLPPTVHTYFRPKSIFNPSHAKGPCLESFYRVVYADFLKLCQIWVRRRDYYLTVLVVGECL